MAEPVTITRHDQIALVALDNPPVNALSHAVRVALIAGLKQLFAAADVAAIVIACEGRTFIAGADIREFGKPPLDPDLPELIEFLDGAPKPTVAAIHGTALGGGLELALACHFRVAAESAKLGLPEVTLGILPGAGGTQRLPRLIGVEPALDLIVDGAPISAAHAQRLGLIDALIAEPVKESAVAFARDAISAGRPARRVSALTVPATSPEVFAGHERLVAERWRGFRAPASCITAVRGAVELPFAEGLTLERSLFKELMASPESRAQRHVFFGEREVAKVPGLPDDTPTRSLRSVAVLGASANASALVRSFTEAGISVTLLADTAEQLERVVSELRGADPTLERVRPTLNYDDARDADLLLESAPDELSAKGAALGRLDAVGKPGAIVATSTTRWEVDSLADATRRPADVVGLHLTLPPAPSKLLEVVRGPRTATATLASVMKLGRSLGKVAVAVRGHVAERLRATLRREAQYLLEEGAQPQEVDSALRELGVPLGPLEAHARPSPQAARRVAEDITMRCLYGLVNEAARLLGDGLAARPLDIDMIAVHGCGFPVYRGGPLFFADQLGLREVRERLVQYREQTGEEHFTPAPLLERLAGDDSKFYRAPR